MKFKKTLADVQKHRKHSAESGAEAPTASNSGEVVAESVTAVPQYECVEVSYAMGGKFFGLVFHPGGIGFVRIDWNEAQRRGIPYGLLLTELDLHPDSDIPVYQGRYTVELVPLPNPAPLELDNWIQHRYKLTAI